MQDAHWQGITLYFTREKEATLGGQNKIGNRFRMEGKRKNQTEAQEGHRSTLVSIRNCLRKGHSTSRTDNPESRNASRFGREPGELKEKIRTNIQW